MPLAPLFWSPVLALLGDAAPAVRQHAAPALGLLGAAATRNTSGGPAKGVQHTHPAPGECPAHAAAMLLLHWTSGTGVQNNELEILRLSLAGLLPSALFDWSLPLLTGQHPGSPPDVGSQFWALTALKEGLAAMVTDTIKRWAAAVFDMCEQLLDSEDTSTHLLLPLLGVVIQVPSHICNPHSVIRLPLGGTALPRGLSCWLVRCAPRCCCIALHGLQLALCHLTDSADLAGGSAHARHQGSLQSVHRHPPGLGPGPLAP